MIVIRILGTIDEASGEAGRPFTPERLDDLLEQWRRDHPDTEKAPPDPVKDRAGL